ncbi:MAG: competence type IV pilus minor pilin ComGG [Bacillota bacterium]
MTPLRSFIRDDSGSITIVTLFIVLGLLMSLTSLMQIYLTEKQFAELERMQLQHHSLHQMTYQLVLNQVNQEVLTPLTGQFTFPNGSTTYTLTEMNDLFLLYIDSRTPEPFTVRHYYALPEAEILFNEP